VSYCRYLLSDGSSFLLTTDYSHLLLEDDSCSAPGAAGGAGGAGGIKAWRNYRREKDERDKRAVELLALIRESDEYKRLQRKLRMLHEHLLDSPNSREIKAKIADIARQIEMMERL
jgi:hypothetical protein